MVDAVGEIKARISIEDVVSEYVQLKRSGRNFKGLSPFTSEKSPSFIVSPEKQIWHDFSSGKGGDVFSFIQEVEGMDFKGALELLARKAGIDLSEFQSKSGSGFEKNDKDRLFSAVEQAVKFYQVQLTQNIPALKYLREARGYEKQTLLDFRFGYSPNDGKSLYKYLIGNNFTEVELQKAGLISKRGNDVYDMFRGRIMIPLLDPQGRAVGFTARQIVNDNNSPKYINTPSTPLYDKSRQVFGLSQAKEAIRKSGYVVVVEGNLDVVASHQAGIKQVVASAGTALTADHLKSLQRFTGDVRLAFDEDRAGQEAVERAIPLAQALGLEMSIVSLPSGKDPDELIKKDPSAWETTLSKSQYMVDWLVDKIAKSSDLSSAQGKRQFTAKIMTIVKTLKDKVEQEHYARVIAEKTNTSFETISAKLFENVSSEKRLKRVKTEQNEPQINREQRVREQHLLACGMKNVEIGKLLSQIPLDVFSEGAQDTASFIQSNPGVSPSESEYAKMLALLYEEHYQHTEQEELIYQARRLLTRLVTSYAKLKKQALANELAVADEQTQTTLLKAVKQLDDLVVQFS
jgi:DNA primase